MDMEAQLRNKHSSGRHRLMILTLENKLFIIYFTIINIFLKSYLIKN